MSQLDHASAVCGYLVLSLLFDVSPDCVCWPQVKECKEICTLFNRDYLNFEVRTKAKHDPTLTLAYREPRKAQ